MGGAVILAENALALPELPAAATGEVRVVDTVPSAMAELLRASPAGVPASVVTVNLGGEAVQRALADRIYAEPGIARLYNVYGPSEDTTFSTWALIERESERAPSIGRPPRRRAGARGGPSLSSRCRWGWRESCSWAARECRAATWGGRS